MTKKRKTIMDLKIGDSVWCLNRNTLDVYQTTVKFVYSWEMKILLDGPRIYYNPLCNICNNEITYITNYGDVVCASKEALDDLIKDKIRKLKSVRKVIFKEDNSQTYGN